MFLQTIIEFMYTWEVRLGVILSMLIQIILIFFGSQRKISKAVLLKILVWSAYVSADAVAVFSLGLLAQNRGESLKGEPLQNHQLHLLWVPFLILHLGGPDTITAYSFEDNKLWLRHLLNLVIQVGVALYAIINSWNNHNNPLTYLVIPTLIWGAVKYCERIWTLKSATLEQIYDHFSSEFSHAPEGTYFDEVYRYLSTLTYCFTNRLNSDRAILDLGKDFLLKTPSEAFSIVEVEMGLMYDLLYTKALLIYSRWGICLRCGYLVSSIASMAIFANNIHKHNEAEWSYPLSDVLITYFLMIGAVVLEIYAISLVVLSDWASIWLDRHKHLSGLVKFMFQINRMCSRALFGEKRWPRRMKQYNILRCLASAPPENRRRTRDVFPVSLLPWKNIDAFLGKDDNSMKEMVFEEIKDRQTVFGSSEGRGTGETSEIDIFSRVDDANEMRKLIFAVIRDRVDPYLKRSGRPGSEWFTESSSRIINEIIKKKYRLTKDASRGALFINRLYRWHIATTLCYHYDKKKGVLVLGGNVEDDNDRSKVVGKANVSRYISDYLMYLARFREKMLPAGNYKQRLEPMESYIRQLKWENFSEVGMSTELKISVGSNVEDVGSRTVYDGTNLAIELETSFETTEKKWEMIAEFWSNMLVYVASHHRWEEHVQLLNEGGEFITHAAFLLAHASMGASTTIPLFFTS